jgi:hypothetical protein
MHMRVIFPPPVSCYHLIILSLAATQDDRGMLTDTATPERPGPWSELVLLENVERPSTVEVARLR